MEIIPDKMQCLGRALTAILRQMNIKQSSINRDANIEKKTAEGILLSRFARELRLTRLYRSFGHNSA